jgi:hypothetical protein
MMGSEKKPFGIYILGIIFLLALVGNIIFSLSISGEPSWYYPHTIFSLMKSIHWLDWLWLGLLALVGLLLFNNHKTSWAMAIFALSMIIGINIYRFISPPFGQENYSDLYMISSFLATAVILALVFFFRYPYIDRRSRWSIGGPAVRQNSRTAVQVVANDIFEGVTESVSISGARILLQRDLGESQSKMRYMDIIFPAIQNIKITCEVIENSGNLLRVRYKKLHRKNRAILMAWLKSQDETK